MTSAGRRSRSIEAGVLAGLVGLAVFLALHHLLIVPIWFIAPAGAVLAAGGGAAVGAAYAELLPHVPARPWRSGWVLAAVAAILAPAILVAQLVGPIATARADRSVDLSVPPSAAVLIFVAGLILPSMLSGAAVGWLVARTRTAAARMAIAGLVLALGPGHNIPFLGGTPVTAKELAILAAVLGAACVTLVEAQALLARSLRAPVAGTPEGEPGPQGAMPAA